MRARTTVDVIVPFAGTEAALEAALARLDRLDLDDGDTLTVVDNRPDEASSPPPRAGVIRAAGRASSYYARNRGAERGNAGWLLFLDADVDPERDLLARYFEPRPDDAVGILAGAIRDAGAADGRRQPAAARYAHLRSSTAHASTASTFAPFAKTANAMVRRAAFEAIGGFREDIRSGGDVDLCFQLAAAGWRLEERSRAAVEHLGRERVRDLLRQQARHGAGTAWLEREYPGFSPPLPLTDLMRWLARGGVRSARAAVRGHRDGAIVAVLDPVSAVAFELGRRLGSNHAT